MLYKPSRVLIALPDAYGNPLHVQLTERVVMDRPQILSREPSFRPVRSNVAFYVTAVPVGICNTGNNSPVTLPADAYVGPKAVELTRSFGDPFNHAFADNDQSMPPVSYTISVAIQFISKPFEAVFNLGAPQ